MITAPVYAFARNGINDVLYALTTVARGDVRQPWLNSDEPLRHASC